MYFKFISEGNTSTYKLFNITSNRLEFNDEAVKFQFVGDLYNSARGYLNQSF